jgi:hypothetical protein
MITGACLVIIALLMLYIWSVVERPVRGTSMAELRLQVRRDVLHIKVSGAAVVFLIAVIAVVNSKAF